MPILPVLDQKKSNIKDQCARTSYYNFMLVTRESAVFMKSVDSTDHIADGGRKNAAYLALLAEQTIRVCAVAVVYLHGAAGARGSTQCCFMRHFSRAGEHPEPGQQ